MHRFILYISYPIYEINLKVIEAYPETLTVKQCHLQTTVYQNISQSSFLMLLVKSLINKLKFKGNRGRVPCITSEYSNAWLVKLFLNQTLYETFP